MFNLERLSKIRWAESDNNIINFFNVLDQNISDKEVSDFKLKSKWSVGFWDLREDEIKEIINTDLIENFPDKIWNQLKIPNVIE